MLSLPRQPMTEIRCAGTPLEMGLAQGAALRPAIHAALQTLTELEAVRLMKPRWLPLPVFLRLADLRAQAFLRRAFAEVPLLAEQRLRGIAEGAGVPYRRLALCSAMEAALSDLGRITSVPLSAACSAVALRGTAFQGGQPVLAHNFDYLPVTQPYYCIRRSSPAGRLRSVEFTVAPLAGSVSGVNEAGLCVTCNYAYATDTAGPGPTMTMLLSEVLSRFRTVSEATEFLTQTPRVGGGLLMLADATGRILSVEISSTRLECREPPPGRDRLCHTNRYCCAATAAIEVAAGAVHGDHSPQALRGRRVHQSAEDRDRQLRQLLDSEPEFDRESLQRMMSSHGSDGAASASTVCMHSDYWHTTASLQLYPAERLLRASFSPACAARYTDFVV